MMAIVNDRPACGRGRGERGGSRVNFLIVMLVLAVAGYSAYNYAPVEFNAYRFKDFMQETVDKASYPPGQSNEWIAQQLRAAATDYNLPPDCRGSRTSGSRSSCAPPRPTTTCRPT